MHTLGALALGDGRPALVRRSAVMMILLVFLMAGTRARLQSRAQAAGAPTTVAAQRVAGLASAEGCVPMERQATTHPSRQAERMYGTRYRHHFGPRERRSGQNPSGRRV
jgi:hypothetical protein